MKEEFKKIKKESMLSKRSPDTEKHVLAADSLVRISDIGPETTKEDIKIAVLHIAEASYIDYVKNEKQGVVRFASKEQVDYFISKLKEEKHLEVKGYNTSISRMPHAEEEEYFKKIASKRLKYQTAKLQAQDAARAKSEKSSNEKKKDKQQAKSVKKIVKK